MGEVVFVDLGIHIGSNSLWGYVSHFDKQIDLTPGERGEREKEVSWDGDVRC